MEDGNALPKTVLQFQLRRQVTNLYKSFLEVIEDSYEDQRQMIERLKKALPTDKHSLIDAANTFDKAKFYQFRKRILDAGNDAIRGLEETMAIMDIQFGTGEGNENS